MRTLFKSAGLFAVLAFTVVAAASAMGFSPVETGGALNLCVEWYEGFTGHEDGLRMLADVGAAGATAELVKEAVKDLRGQLEKQSESIQEEIKSNLKAQIGDLEKRIAAGEKAGEGVAELKQEHDARSQANAEFIEKIEKMVQKHADSVNERIDEIEKAAPKSDSRSFNYGKGLAEAVQKSGMTQHDEKMRAVYKFDGMFPHARKDISVTGSTVYEPQYVPGIIGPGERELRVRNLLPRNRTSNHQVFFVLETALTDNAGPQDGLGTTKGETTFQVTVDSETVQTIAHFIQVPLQLLDDIPALEDYTNGRMMFLLDQEEEDQLLYGNNLNSNLNGLMTQATAFDTTLLTELNVDTPTDIDRLRAAIAQVQVAEYSPSGIVMHPYNWAGIEMLKDSDKRYLFASPQDRSIPRMWGLPVVSTTAMQSPDFLVGAFMMGAAIWDRQESRIAISTEDSDNFQKNMATIRAEERIALTVYRPLSFVEGDFAATVT